MTHVATPGRSGWAPKALTPPLTLSPTPNPTPKPYPYPKQVRRVYAAVGAVLAPRALVAVVSWRDPMSIQAWPGTARHGPAW